MFRSAVAMPSRLEGNGGGRYMNIANERRVLGTMSFPAPFGDLAGTFVRSARRLAATVPGEARGPSSI